MEIFKDVTNYEGLYKVSNLGNVFSERKQINLKPGDNGRGYQFVNLWKNKTCVRFYVHRLIALEFIKNSDNKPQVNHIDCDKKNNKVDNLEWCNSFENMQHASLNKKLYCSDFQKKQTSLANRGIKSHLSKLSEIDVIGIKKELQENIKTQKEISFLFNTTSANVGAIKRGKSWKHIKL